MIDLKEELKTKNLDEIIKFLEDSDDDENSLLLLQLIQLNLELKIEEDKKKKLPENKSNDELKKKLDYIVSGFLAKQYSTVGNNIDVSSIVEKETGLKLLPKTAKERDTKALNIIKSLVKNKCKKLKIKEPEIQSKKQLTAKLKEMNKSLKYSPLEF